MGPGSDPGDPGAATKTTYDANRPRGLRRRVGCRRISGLHHDSRRDRPRDRGHLAGGAVTTSVCDADGNQVKTVASAWIMSYDAPNTTGTVDAFPLSNERGDVLALADKDGRAIARYPVLGMGGVGECDHRLRDRPCVQCQNPASQWVRFGTGGPARAIRVPCAWETA